MEEVPIQDKAERGEIQKEDVVTQEPTSPRVVAEVPMQEETVETLIEEAVTLPVQSVQAETLNGKVCTQFSKNFVNLDSDDEENAGDERIQGMIKELSLLKVEVKKWKRQVDKYQEGIIPLIDHKNTISELREKWVEDLMFQKLRWEEIQKELKELKNFKSMQVEKDQMYTLSQELLSTRAPSPSYPVFLFEQFICFKLKPVKEGRPYEMATSAQFLETFM